MSGLSMGNLQIIKKNPVTEVKTSNIEVAQRDTFINKIEKIQNEYKHVQKGNISETDFKKLLMRNHPRLLSPINNLTRTQLNQRLKHLINWYIEIKNILIGYNDATKDNLQFRELTKLYTDLKVFTDTDRFGKEQSIILKDIVNLFLIDNPLNPNFGVSENLGRVLAKTNRNTSYIKELTLCFSLYRKYLNTLASDFVKAFEYPEGIDASSDQRILKALPDPEVTFRTIYEIQPQFQMINSHINKSVDTTLSNHKEHARNFNTEIFGNLNNLNKDIIPLTTNQEVSNMGIKKRLNEINNWISNGLIHAQHQYNRLNNLKIVRTDNNINKNFDLSINDNFKVWCVIKDTEKYLESIEDLLLAKSFLTGMVNTSNLEVLEVNY